MDHQLINSIGEQIARDARFRGIEQSLIEDSLEMMIGSGKAEQLGAKGTLDHLYESISTAAAQAHYGLEKAIHQGLNHAPEIEARQFAKLKPAGAKVPFGLDKMEGQEKVYLGISLLVGGLSLMGAVSSFSQALRKDEQGNTKVEWSQVGMGVVNTALAAGNAYLAHNFIAAASAR